MEISVVSACYGSHGFWGGGALMERGVLYMVERDAMERVGARVR